MAAAILAMAGPAAAQTVPVVHPPFDGQYMLMNLGAADGVHPPYGGVTFAPGVTNAIVIGGYAGAEVGTLFEAGLTRDATHSITGFAGPASVLAAAYGVDGGVAYAPNGVLFYTRVTYSLGEVLPDSSVTDKVVDLSALTWRPGGLNFVPPGLDGAGTLKITTWAYGDWWSFTISPDDTDTGTYDVTAGTRKAILQGNPQGFVYAMPGTPGFTNPTLLVCETGLSYGAGNITAYDVDQQGDPIVASRRVIVSGLDQPVSIAIDPVTGDLLFTGYLGTVYLLRQAPLPPTTTTTTSTTSTSTTTTSTSTSSTLRPTTTSTAAPTTTTTSSTVPTTSSTTIHTTTSTTVHSTTTSTTVPTTSSTSTTTVHPTTTSTSSSTTTSTITSASSTTTTLPSACGAEPPDFRSIACEVDALLALVRESTELRALQVNFVARLERAQATVADGIEQCADGQRAAARYALARLERQMMLLRARTRTHRARKTLPKELAERIGNDARNIAADAHVLAGSLTCP